MAQTAMKILLTGPEKSDRIVNENVIRGPFNKVTLSEKIEQLVMCKAIKCVI